MERVLTSDELHALWMRTQNCGTGMVFGFCFAMNVVCACTRTTLCYSASRDAGVKGILVHNAWSGSTAGSCLEFVCPSMRICAVECVPKNVTFRPSSNKGCICLHLHSFSVIKQRGHFACICTSTLNKGCVASNCTLFRIK